MATMSPGSTARKAMALVTFTTTETTDVQLRRLANRLRHDLGLRDLIIRTTNIDNHNWEAAATKLDNEADAAERAANDPTNPFDGLPVE